MTAPALARGRTGRRYIWPPNTQTPELTVPSVTTILAQLAKPALVGWAAKSVAEYAVEHIHAWEGLPVDAAIDMLKRSPYRNMTKAGDIGTAVHAAIDNWTMTQAAQAEWEPLEIELDLVPYVAGALGFIEDLVEEVTFSEVTIFNRTYQYAGTTDVIVKLKDGRRAICDWKTGKAIYPEVALQLCAYANGEFIGHDDGNVSDLPPIDVGIVVHLPGTGSYVAKEIPLTPRLWKTFQALRSVQLWKDDFEADALGKTHKGSAKTADAAPTSRKKGNVAQTNDD